MKCIKLIMAVGTVMMAMMVAFAAPVMADRDDDHRDGRHGFFFNDHRFDDRDFDHRFGSFDNDFDRRPWWWNNWKNHEDCWWEWSSVFERWELECD